MFYDIHVYFRNNLEMEEARIIEELLKDNNVKTFPFIEVPVGPHPYPMFEAHINDSNKDFIISEILKVNKLSPVLVHKKTGNHLFDHTDGATWLGERLDLNLAFFDNFS